MSILDLLFLAVAFATAIVLTIALRFAVFGPRRQSLRLLGVWGGCLAIYGSIVLISSLFTKQRAYALGDEVCSDDWCIVAERADATPTSSGVSWTVGFRLISHARRVSMRERNVVVYLQDSAGGRHDPLPDSVATPFDVRMDPGSSVSTTRTFLVAPSTHVNGIVVTREGGFSPTPFIIGIGPFAKPPIVRVQG
jgi:hypothetical protein